MAPASHPLQADLQAITPVVHFRTVRTGYGPSSEPEIHVVDEHLRIADLIAAAAGYGAIVRAVLG